MLHEFPNQMFDNFWYLYSRKLKTIDDIKVAHSGLKIDVVQQNKADIKFYSHTKVSAIVFVPSEDV